MRDVFVLYLNPSADQPAGFVRCERDGRLVGIVGNIAAASELYSRTDWERWLHYNPEFDRRAWILQVHQRL